MKVQDRKARREPVSRRAFYLCDAEDLFCWMTVRRKHAFRGAADFKVQICLKLEGKTGVLRRRGVDENWIVRAQQEKYETNDLDKREIHDLRCYCL